MVNENQLVHHSIDTTVMFSYISTVTALNEINEGKICVSPSSRSGIAFDYKLGRKKYFYSLGQVIRQFVALDSATQHTVSR